MTAQFSLIAPMRQMVVPQSGHLPFTMGFPFLVRPSFGSAMAFLALHFTQYASIFISNPLFFGFTCGPYAFRNRVFLLWTALLRHMSHLAESLPSL